MSKSINIQTSPAPSIYRPGQQSQYASPTLIMLLKAIMGLAAIPAVLACKPDETMPGFKKGCEGSIPETDGYFTNHISLNVNNLTRSMDFYGNVFGFRHMFTFNLSPHVTFTYMGHSSGGVNGSGYQSVDELIAQKNNQKGMLEFVYLDLPKEDIPPPVKQTGLLNHIGIIVPDLNQTQSRLEKMNVDIYKKIGQGMPKTGPLSKKSYFGDTTHMTDEEFEMAMATMGKLNEKCIFAADPDGNLLEILPHDEGNLFSGGGK